VRFVSNLHVLFGAFALTLAAAGCSSAVIVHGDGGAGRGGGGAAGSPTGTGGNGTGGSGPGGAGGAAAGTGGKGTGGSASGGNGGAAAGGTGGSPGTGGGTGGRPDAGASLDAAPSVTPTTAGQIVVTELMHDTDVVADDFGEWFEIYNPGTAVTYDLYGCQIRDTANVHTIVAHLMVPPHAFRTLAIFATGGGFVPDYTYSGIKFDNSNADLVAIYCGPTLIDQFSYTKSQAQTSGHSFSVDPAHYNAVDNDNPAYYCDGTSIYDQATASGGKLVTDYGSPGVSNPPCP
jgi:hypothetical protein